MTDKRQAFAAGAVVIFQLALAFAIAELYQRGLIVSPIFWFLGGLGVIITAAILLSRPQGNSVAMIARVPWWRWLLLLRIPKPWNIYLATFAAVYIASLLGSYAHGDQNPWLLALGIVGAGHLILLVYFLILELLSRLVGPPPVKTVHPVLAWGLVLAAIGIFYLALRSI